MLNIFCMVLLYSAVLSQQQFDIICHIDTSDQAEVAASETDYEKCSLFEVEVKLFNNSIQFPVGFSNATLTSLTLKGKPVYLWVSAITYLPGMPFAEIRLNESHMNSFIINLSKNMKVYNFRGITFAFLFDKENITDVFEVVKKMKSRLLNDQNLGVAFMALFERFFSVEQDLNLTAYDTTVEYICIMDLALSSHGTSLYTERHDLKPKFTIPEIINRTFDFWNQTRFPARKIVFTLVTEGTSYQINNSQKTKTHNLKFPDTCVTENSTNFARSCVSETITERLIDNSTMYMKFYEDVWTLAAKTMHFKQSGAGGIHVMTIDGNSFQQCRIQNPIMKAVMFGLENTISVPCERQTKICNQNIQDFEASIESTFVIASQIFIPPGTKAYLSCGATIECLESGNWSVISDSCFGNSVNHDFQLMPYIICVVVIILCILFIISVTLMIRFKKRISNLPANDVSYQVSESKDEHDYETVIYDAGYIEPRASPAVSSHYHIYDDTL